MRPKLPFEITELSDTRFRSKILLYVSMFIAISFLNAKCGNSNNNLVQKSNEPAILVEGYTVEYSSDPNTDATLKLKLKGVQKPIPLGIGQGQIGTLVSMLNGSTVNYKVNANVYVITPKNQNDAVATF